MTLEDLYLISAGRILWGTLIRIVVTVLVVVAIWIALLFISAAQGKS